MNAPTNTTSPHSPKKEKPKLMCRVYGNKPKTFYQFTDGAHRIVTTSGTHVRATKQGVVIPRIRLSKKQRIRMRRAAEQEEVMKNALITKALGRGPEVRALFVQYLNEFETVVGRPATDAEKDFITKKTLEDLPDAPPVAESNTATEPPDSPFQPHPNSFP